MIFSRLGRSLSRLSRAEVEAVRVFSPFHLIFFFFFQFCFDYGVYYRFIWFLRVFLCVAMDMGLGFRTERCRVLQFLRVMEVD